MRTLWLQPIAQKFELSKKCYISRAPDGPRKTRQNRLFILSTGKISQELRQKDFLGRSGDQTSVHITGLNFYVDRKLQNCYHNVTFKGLAAFDPQLDHHQGVTLNTPSSPSRINLGKGMDSNLISLC